jgi:Tfp pilus assembly protein PilZ
MISKTILISAKVKTLIDLDGSFSEREGFTLLVAKDTGDMLQLARTKEPDIIFISPASTKEDSTCYRLLKEDSRINHIPMVAIVDSSHLAELTHVQNERPDDVLFTPVNTHLFLASARRILGLSSRAFPRQQTSLLIHFGATNEQLQTACAFNVSTGGVFIATENHPPLDDSVHLQIDLITAIEPILCQGVVTWHNDAQKPVRPEMPTGFGVQFASLKVADLFAIRNFIDEMAKVGKNQ